MVASLHHLFHCYIIFFLSTTPWGVRSRHCFITKNNFTNSSAASLPHLFQSLHYFLIGRHWTVLGVCLWKISVIFSFTGFSLSWAQCAKRHVYSVRTGSWWSLCLVMGKSSLWTRTKYFSLLLSLGCVNHRSCAKVLLKAFSHGSDNCGLWNCHDKKMCLPWKVKLVVLRS